MHPQPILLSTKPIARYVGGVVAWLDAYFSLSLSLSFDFTFLCTPSLLPPLSFVVVAPPSLSVQVGVGNPLRRKVATKGGEAAGEGSGADSDSSKDSSGGTKSPYAGSEGELVDGVGDDDEVEGVVGRGRGGGGGPRSADEVDELAALDAEVNAELGIGLGDDLDDDDDGDDGKITLANRSGSDTCNTPMFLLFSFVRFEFGDFVYIKVFHWLRMPFFSSSCCGPYKWVLFFSFRSSVYCAFSTQMTWTQSSKQKSLLNSAKTATRSDVAIQAPLLCNKLAYRCAIGGCLLRKSNKKGSSEVAHTES